VIDPGPGGGRHADRGEFHGSHPRHAEDVVVEFGMRRLIVVDRVELVWIRDLAICAGGDGLTITREKRVALSVLRESTRPP